MVLTFRQRKSVLQDLIFHPVLLTCLGYRVAGFQQGGRYTGLITRRV